MNAAPALFDKWQPDVPFMQVVKSAVVKATASGKVLINCEELVWGGHGVGVLKDLLTSDTLFINRKN
eukprot:COSAG01_NODE_12673_length_1701_cov_6.781523_2_plen_67_part_00